MDIVDLLTRIASESATAALALFAIWSLKRSYEERLRERDSYAVTMKAMNETLIETLSDSTSATATNTEVIRQNNDVLERLRRLLDTRVGV